MVFGSESLWLPVDDFPGYEVNQYGQVRSTRYKKSLELNPNGFAVLTIAPRKQRSVRPAKLVLQTFRGIDFEEDIEIVWLDGDKRNNRLDNLTFQEKVRVNNRHRDEKQPRVRCIDCSAFTVRGAVCTVCKSGRRPRCKSCGSYISPGEDCEVCIKGRPHCTCGAFLTGSGVCTKCEQGETQTFVVYRGDR